MFSVVDLWFATRAHGGQMGGRILPCAGAIADQPAALMDAFMLLDSFAREEEA
ncbi:hypothetical protein [Sphingomonas solaris]|uniref:hypothetical protein n=1 Tax=Alterirhizorhabdus solaris TaxID=2529389 RepID=UPI001396C524|nr:hypothetical protein [Sphingomonas solaris]